MTKDEALKLALEALLKKMSCDDDCKCSGQQAITAIKEALANEALDKMAKNARELGLDYEPEQESVTWRNAAIRVGEDLCSVGPFRYYDMTAEQWLDWALSVVTVHAPPPQRTWVGLTDEEMQSIAFKSADALSAVFVAEAKLKEKNNE